MDVVMATCPARWKMTSGWSVLTTASTSKALRMSPWRNSMGFCPADERVRIHARFSDAPWRERLSKTVTLFWSDEVQAEQVGCEIAADEPASACDQSVHFDSISLSCGLLKLAQLPQRVEVTKRELEELALTLARFAATKGHGHLAYSRRRTAGHRLDQNLFEDIEVVRFHLHRLQDCGAIQPKAVGHVPGMEVEDHAEGKVEDIGHPDEDCRVFGVSARDIARSDDNVEISRAVPTSRRSTRRCASRRHPCRAGACHAPRRCRCGWRRHIDCPRSGGCGARR